MLAPKNQKVGITLIYRDNSNFFLPYKWNYLTWHCIKSGNLSGKGMVSWYNALLYRKCTTDKEAPHRVAETGVLHNQIAPGFVIPIRPSNISMTGSVPGMEKSWWINALPTASLIAKITHTHVLEHSHPHNHLSNERKHGHRHTEKEIDEALRQAHPL